jgi:hypothetical protein
MEQEDKSERKPQIGFQVTPDLIEAINEIKKKTGLSLSHLGKTALWEKIAEIRATHPAYEHERQAA